jgi:hypothetical protein
MDGQNSIPSRDKIFLSSIVSKPALGSTQPLIQWEQGALSPGIKRLGREANYSPPASANVKDAGAVLLLPPKSPWNCAQLIKPRDNFTFTFTF